MKHKLLNENSFQIQGQCNLHLWPTDPNNDRSLSLSMTNLPTKFVNYMPKQTSYQLDKLMTEILLTKCHEDWNKNVDSNVLTMYFFHLIQ